jgi:hypothetical protein
MFINPADKTINGIMLINTRVNFKILKDAKKPVQMSANLTDGERNFPRDRPNWPAHQS